MIIRTVQLHLCEKVKPLGLTLVLVVCFLAAILVLSATVQSKDTRRASELAGMKAQDWHVKGWLNSNPVDSKSVGQGCVSPVVDGGLPFLLGDRTIAERILSAISLPGAGNHRILSPQVQRVLGCRKSLSTCETAQVQVSDSYRL